MDESQQLQRPVSRRGEHKNMAMVDAYGTNAGPRPGTSIRGLASARPTSTRPPSALSSGTASRLTSAMHNTASTLSTFAPPRIGTAIGFADNITSERVLTQHGLSGLPTATQSRIGTTAGGMRQIKDARYWQSQLQLKMDEIRKEIDRLMKEKQNMDREKSAQKSFEKKVKEATKDLTVLQGKLSDMNITLDAANSNVSRQQMQQETVALRERNETLQSQLETVFGERQAKETINATLEKEIEAERNKINKVIEAMPDDEQTKYRQLEQLAQKLGNENNKMHEQINEMMNQKTNLETMVRSTNERNEAVRLMTKLNELQLKLNAAKEEEQNRLTPAQEREKLIADVRENKQALNSIQHQIKIAEDTLTEKRELLQQIEDDLDEGGSERHAKYKELRVRDETMTIFMETFKDKMEEEKKKIEMIKNQITSALEQVTMHGINLKTLGISKVANLSEKNDLSSEDGLVKEYKRLSVQLKQLQILGKRYTDTLATLQKDDLTIADDINKFSNLDALRSEAAKKIELLSSRLEELKHKKRVTEDVVEGAIRRNEEVKEQLHSNENYRQISHLEETLADLMEEGKTLQRTYDQLKKETAFDDVRGDAKEKLADILALLRHNT